MPSNPYYPDPSIFGYWSGNNLISTWPTDDTSWMGGGGGGIAPWWDDPWALGGGYGIPGYGGGIPGPDPYAWMSQMTSPIPDWADKAGMTQQIWDWLVQNLPDIVRGGEGTVLDWWRTNGNTQGNVPPEPTPPAEPPAQPPEEPGLRDPNDPNRGTGPADEPRGIPVPADPAGTADFYDLFMKWLGYGLDEATAWVMASQGQQPPADFKAGSTAESPAEGGPPPPPPPETPEPLPIPTPGPVFRAWAWPWVSPQPNPVEPPTRLTEPEVPTPQPATPPAPPVPGPVHYIDLPTEPPPQPTPTTPPKPPKVEAPMPAAPEPPPPVTNPPPSEPPPQQPPPGGGGAPPSIGAGGGGAGPPGPNAPIIGSRLNIQSLFGMPGYTQPPMTLNDFMRALYQAPMMGR